jgi:hypothetical protein
MNNDLALFTTGEIQPGWGNRALARQARQIDAEVALTRRKVAGAMLVGADIMERTVELDTHRRQLAGNDEVLNAILCETELNTIRQAQAIARQMYS